MNHLQKLESIANTCTGKKMPGLSKELLEQFVGKDARLQSAIDEAYSKINLLREEFSEFFMLDEKDQIVEIQKDFVNFYDPFSVNPYIALAAKGPWIVTTCGAVLHDSGGYGMLGLGHCPDVIMKELQAPHVMANIMTANFSQIKFTKTIAREIGHRRKERQCPFSKFLCLNSGSESVTMATRFSDLNAAILTAAGGRHAGKKVKFLSLKGGFHGRTDRPAQMSDSSLGKYKEYLASFKERDNLDTVAPNDCEGLKAIFAKAEKENIFYESFFMEPVMGEGDPGKGITPEFYSLARELTEKEGTLLVVDSIQAGIRAHGCLSIVDYPGFENLPAPDMETYSKALNAGQFPLSVLAMKDNVAKLYKHGVYGNTMTGNPKGLEVGCAVLGQLTPETRLNIQERGKEFLDKFNQIKCEFPNLVTKVQGVGLLVSIEFDAAKTKVVGENGLEYWMRVNGVGVIHGGENSLRFTPYFGIQSEEIDIIMRVLRSELKKIA